MSRDTIITRIRAASPRTTAPHRAPPSTPPSLVSYGSDAIARFRAAASAKGVTVVDAAAPHSLPAAIAEALTAAHIAPQPIRLNDPQLADLDWAAARLTIARGRATHTDAITLSRALAAVAETGTLLLTSSRDNPTTLAFLSEIHLVALDRTTILGTFEDATALLRRTYGASLPRTVNFISGASRTGDIGGRIVHGAHGPRRLFAFIH